MKKSHHFFLFLINSNIFVSFCVLSLAISSEFLVVNSKILFPSEVSLFVFFATIFTYNFQRIVRISKSQKHNRKDWTQENKFLIYLVMIICSAISLYFFSKFKTNTQIAIIFSGIISVLYPFGLRTIPFSKILVISLIWTTSTMLLLILENEIIFSSNVITHLLNRFLFVFAICIPFDIRDIKYDNIKLKTIPIVFGVLRSKLISFICLLFVIIISTFQYWNNKLSIGFFIAISLSCIVSSIFIKKSNEKKSEFFFSFWVESLSILLYLFLVISITLF